MAGGPLDRRALALRTALALALLAGAATLLDRIGWVPPLPVWLSPLLFGLGLVSATLAWPWGAQASLARTHHAEMHVRPDGSFTWRPAGEPLSGGLGAHPTHGLHDPPGDARRSEVRLSFELPDETPPRLLRSALQRGVRAARRVDGPDKVRARGEWRDVAGPTSHANVRLSLEGHALDVESARVASEAFAEAFVGRLSRAGLEAWQRR